MARIAPPELLPDVRIGPIPEAPQVARRLDGPAVRGQKLEDHDLLVRPHARAFPEAEKLLQLHGCDDTPVLAVLEAHATPARNLETIGRPPFDGRALGRRKRI